MCMAEDKTVGTVLAWRRQLHRGLRAGHACGGLPRNLGGLIVSSWQFRLRPGEQTDPAGVSSSLVTDKDTREVPPSEGNEARWDGRPGVRVSHITVEGGEPCRRDPLEERARRVAELL